MTALTLSKNNHGRLNERTVCRYSKPWNACLSFLLFVSVLMSPRLVVGTVVITWQDLLLPILLTTLLFDSLRGQLVVPRVLITSWLIYFVYSSIISCVNIALGNVDIRAFLYLGREAEYFIFGMFMYSRVKQRLIPERQVSRTLRFCVFASVTYGFLQFFTGARGHYGVGALGSTVSAASGVTYFVCFALAISLLIDSKKSVDIALVIGSLICVLLTITRTYIAGSVFLLCWLMSWNILRYKDSRRWRWVGVCVAIGLLLIMGIAPGISAKIVIYLEKIAERFSHFEAAADVRLGMSSEYLKLVSSPGLFLFGAGKGFPEYKTGRTSFAVDNQYTRNLLETGLVGSALWTMLLITTIKETNRRLLYSPHKRLLATGFIVTYLIMAFMQELFQVARGGALFWMVLGSWLGSQPQTTVIQDV